MIGNERMIFSLISHRASLEGSEIIYPLNLKRVINDWNNKMRLKDKNAVVTGAGSGIGRAISRGFAREGARVVVSDIIPARAEETVEMIQSAGGEAMAVETDVTKKDQVDRLYATAFEAYQRIHISVSVPGISTTRNFLDLPEDEWDHVVDTTLKHHYLCGQVAARPHGRTRWGGNHPHLLDM